MRLSDRSKSLLDLVGDKSAFVILQITIEVSDALPQGIAALPVREWALVIISRNSEALLDNRAVVAK